MAYSHADYSAWTNGKVTSGTYKLGIDPAQFATTIDTSRYRDLYMKMTDPLRASEKPKKKGNVMDASYNVKRIKDMELSEDEIVLREYGMRDETGNWTRDARVLMIEILLDERRKDIVERVNKLKAYDTKGKK